MNENKIKVETGRTIINNTSRKQRVSVMQVNNKLDEMQSNFNNIEYGANTSNQNYGGFNMSNLSNMLPLISMLSGKNSMSNIMEMLPKLSQNNNGNSSNMLSTLMPLIQSLSNKKGVTSAKKIDSLKRADQD